MEANWDTLVIVGLVVIIVVLLIAYLFKIKAIGGAEVEVGAPGFTVKLKLQDKERNISESDFALININDNYADSDIGFVIRKPLSDEWSFKTKIYREILKDKGYKDQFIDNYIKILGNTINEPNKNIHVNTFRREGIHTLKYNEKVIINGNPIDKGAIERINSTSTNGEEKNYDQLNIFAYKKDAYKIKKSLLDIFLAEVAFIGTLGPKKLYVNNDNSVFLLDCSAVFENVVYDGQLGTHVVNNMGLYQENKQYIFVIYLSYIQTDDKPTKVWDELREYLASFRVLTK